MPVLHVFFDLLYDAAIIIELFVEFESIKQISPYQVEYWSARDLAPLLGYNKWQNFEVAIQRATISCQQVGQIVEDHFTGISKYEL